MWIQLGALAAATALILWRLSKMATREELNAGIDALKATIASEKAELLTKLGALDATIEALKAEIAAGGGADFAAELAAVDEANAAVRGFVEPV